jgi:hypothetical protein
MTETKMASIDPMETGAESRQASEDLESELRAMQIADAQDLVLYLPLAARLAALDRPEWLRDWPARAGAIAADIQPLLMERAEEGIWDLTHALGEDLALAVISAQDFHCFAVLERDFLQPLAAEKLRQWTREANAVQLDEEAAETLQQFRTRFPVPPELLLRPLAAPLGPFMEAVLAAHAGPRVTIERRWPPLPKKHLVDEEQRKQDDAALYVLDGGQVPETLSDRFDRLNVPIDCGTLGILTVSRRLFPDWVVEFEVKLPEHAPGVRLVRWESHPAVPQGAATDGAQRWIVDLNPLRRSGPPDELWAVLWATLVINFENNLRLQLIN